MKIRILCIGKIKDKNILNICNSYIKKISHFISIDIVELNEINFSVENDENIEKVKKHEKKEFEKYLDNSYNISFCIEGKEMNSFEFANEIENTMVHFSSKKFINFIIGGSYGIHNEIKKICDRNISFSKLTFNHQIFRLILLEQIYRAFTLINNINYHK